MNAAEANRRLREHLDAVAAIGDWQGPEPSLTMAERKAEWHAQYLARRGARERWAHWAMVARLSAERGDPDAARVAEVYASAAIYAPTSVWWVIEGAYDPWDEVVDEAEIIAGPYPSEGDALDVIARSSDDEGLCAVPAVPGCRP